MEGELLFRGPFCISALDWQVRFVKLEKRIDLFCFTYKLLFQTTKICILLHSFRRACWDSSDLLYPLFLLRLFPRHRTATFRPLSAASILPHS